MTVAMECSVLIGYLAGGKFRYSDAKRLTHTVPETTSVSRGVTYRFLPECEGSTLESMPERRRREGADERSTPEYERYGTDLSRAVRFTCLLKYYTSTGTSSNTSRLCVCLRESFTLVLASEYRNLPPAK